MVAQLRAALPNAIGGVLWFANDDANMVPFTPVYCGAQEVPECYADGTANDHEFSWKSAFWLCNWVSNMVYPRYATLFPDLEKERKVIEEKNIQTAADFEAKAVALLETEGQAAVQKMLTARTHSLANEMMERWNRLGIYLIMKHNDQGVKKEKDGKFELTPDGICVPVDRPGYTEQYKKILIRETGERFAVPQQ